MKYCSKCKETKEETCFNKNCKNKDGLQFNCKLCQKIIDRKSYTDNPKRRVAIRLNDKNRIKEIRDYLYSYLLKNPCIDCSEKDPIVLEFDHKYDKKFAIADGMRQVGLATLKLELLKCEVVCSNCHKKRTAKQCNNWKINYADIAQLSVQHTCNVQVLG